MTQHSVYALCEPGTLDVRYVGVTNQPIHIRLAAHVSKAKMLHSHIGQWISSLSANGKRPDCILLTQCPSEMAREVEQAWIVLFIENGYDMLNVRDCNNKGKERVRISKEKRLHAKQAPRRDIFYDLDTSDPEYGDKMVDRLAGLWHLSHDDFLTAARWVMVNDTDMFEAIRQCLGVEAVFDYEAAAAYGNTEAA